MAATTGRKNWARPATQVALVLSIGAVAAAAIGAIGSGQGAWPFGTGFAVLRYAVFAAMAGGVVALVALVLAWRRRDRRLVTASSVALVVALAFLLYLGNYVRIARSVPALHDISTNLEDVPQFGRLSVRADNMETIPDQGKAALKALDPESRWKAVHQEAYGDIVTVRLAASVPDTIRRAEALARDRGWAIARVDTEAGVLEATDTSLFFRFKDDVVVRARPAPDGGSLVDMRSISRVGGSDIGVNAKRIRAFLKDLQQA